MPYRRQYRGRRGRKNDFDLSKIILAPLGVIQFGMLALTFMSVLMIPGLLIVPFLSKNFLSQTPKLLLYPLMALPSIIGIVIYQMVKLRKEKARQRKLEQQVCLHGNLVGTNSMRCPLCKGEFEQRKTDAEKERQAKEWKMKLSQDADRLERSEISRLKNASFKHLDDLKKLSPREFEIAISKLFTALGFEASLNSGSNDMGIDILLRKDNLLHVVQCKRYKASASIGREMIQMFHSAVIHSQASKGLYVTTSSFTSTAVQYVKGKNIELIDGKKLLIMYEKLFPANDESLKIIKLMCKECGQLIQLDIHGNTDHSHCKNGHLVRSTHDLNTLRKMANIKVNVN